ncbi:hypothetical protein [Streptomyces sp. NPDC048650]|uniref:hypothetical protein n=1 Tax=unclassified Streptomyces TaxID=2593676 RepID=UPI00371B2FCF
MAKIFGGDGNELPPLELEGGNLGPAEEYRQRQVQSWSRLPVPFALLVPWVWLYVTVTSGPSVLPAVLAVVLTHAALVVAWAGRSSGRRVLTWAGLAGYPTALALCLLLAKAL